MTTPDRPPTWWSATGAPEDLVHVLVLGDFIATVRAFEQRWTPTVNLKLSNPDAWWTYRLRPGDDLLDTLEDAKAWCTATIQRVIRPRAAETPSV